MVAELCAMSPLGRIGKPEELAKTVVHLPSNETRSSRVRSSSLTAASLLVIRPEEIGALAVWMASDVADFIHGRALECDGGWLTAARHMF